MQGTGAVEVVVDFLDGVSRRVAVGQVERADRAFNLIGHRHAGSYGRGILEARIGRDRVTILGEQAVGPLSSVASVAAKMICLCLISWANVFNFVSI